MRSSDLAHSPHARHVRYRTRNPDFGRLRDVQVSRRAQAGHAIPRGRGGGTTAGGAFGGVGSGMGFTLGRSGAARAAQTTAVRPRSSAAATMGDSFASKSMRSGHVSQAIVV